MRIALINVGFEPGEGDLRPAPPYGIMTVGAYLESKGHEVLLFDWSGEKIDDDKRRSLLNAKPELVGLHVKISTALLRAIQVSKWAKANKIPVVWGGPGTMVIPELMLREGPVDYLVLGEGEQTISELVDALEQNLPLQDIKGLAYLEEGQYIRTAARERITDLNSLPKPLWNKLGDLARYFTPLYGRNAISLVTSRGCPGNCTFCYSKMMWGYKWYALSPQRVVDDIEEIMRLDPRISGFIIMDDLFATDPQRVKDICSIIIDKKLDIVWNCEIRADMIDRSLLAVMKQAGCKQILVGVESGSDRLLQMVRKDVSAEEIIQAAKLIHEADMEVYAMVINGLPTETKEDIKRTERMLDVIKPEYTEFLTYMPYPGTVLFDSAVEHGFSPPTNLEGWGDMGTFSVASIHDKGLTSYANKMYLAMEKRTKRKATMNSYLKSISKDPFSAPLRALRFMMKRKGDNNGA